ncbi:MAG: hypothetical protein HYU64_14615 [Armatimonadetes bacterium]|nr:hypothetical protein [Armatimonadota bacterium]
MIQVDRYTKFVLTVIAIALMLIAFRPLVEPRVAVAEKGVVEVNLKSIGGWSLNSSNPIPVKIVDEVRFKQDR